MSNFSAPLDRLRRTGLPFRDGISARKLGEFHSGILKHPLVICPYEVMETLLRG